MMGSLSEASRPIMWNISNAWIMYLLLGISLLVFTNGTYHHIRRWSVGKSDESRFAEYGPRAILTIKEILLQRRVRNERLPAFFHSFIFYSFLVLIFTTTVVALDYDFGTHLFKGFFYAILTVAAEIAGLFILIGVGIAAVRRYVIRSESLETTALDGLALALIASIIATGFLIEGLRIATIGDHWSYLSPIGLATSFLFSGASEKALHESHQIFWWIHTLLAMGWIAVVPYTKFFHLISIPANIYFSKLGARGALSRTDIDKALEAEDFDEDSFNIGVGAMKDFTWKQRLDLDACLNCGRCEQVCPSYTSSKSFSPRQMIIGLKKFVDKSDDIAIHLKEKSVGAKAACAPTEVIGNVFDEDFIWQCRTCSACMEVCPACIEHVDTLIEIRRNEVVMNGRMPEDASRSLKMLERMGNPFGPQDDRIDWISELGVPILGKGESCDVLYWIGCCTTFDPAKQKIAMDLCVLLGKCGIDFAVLGADEHCCGDPARVLGQEHLFQTIAKEQVEELNNRSFKVLLASCPHCYNVLKNEYPQFGGNYNVVHHSEFLHEMLWSGFLTPQYGQRCKIVYHDPCYLGRYQKIFDSPREVLKAIPNATIIEMRNHRERSFCCGAGGGHYWMDLKTGERINNLRINQAQEVGADTIVTSCAYCIQMLTDSVKAMDLEENIRVIDIATLTLESLKGNQL